MFFSFFFSCSNLSACFKGLKLDAVLEGRHSVIKIEALGHTLVFDDLTRENDIDRDSEKWEVHFGNAFDDLNEEEFANRSGKKKKKNY